MAAGEPAARLVLVGSGDGQSLSVEDELRARAAAPPLAGRVVLAGRQERVADWLRAADLFVFPSLFEGLGISLVEAMACGLPAIGSRTGGIVDVIDDGRTGVLVPPGDARALAAAMGRLLADAARRAEMGVLGRRDMVTRFDERDTVTKYRALFASLGAGAARAARPAKG